MVNSCITCSKYNNFYNVYSSSYYDKDGQANHDLKQSYLRFWREKERERDGVLTPHAICLTGNYLDMELHGVRDITSTNPNIKMTMVIVPQTNATTCDIGRTIYSIFKRRRDFHVMNVFLENSDLVWDEIQRPLHDTFNHDRWKDRHSIIPIDTKKTETQKPPSSARYLFFESHE